MYADHFKVSRVSQAEQIEPHLWFILLYITYASRVNSRVADAMIGLIPGEVRRREMSAIIMRNLSSLSRLKAAAGQTRGVPAEQVPLQNKSGSEPVTENRGKARPKG